MPEGRAPRVSTLVAVGIGVVLALLVVGLGATLVVGRDDGGPSRQDVVAGRGADVMPFDLDATTHRFTPSQTGGTQVVVADDGSARAQIALVRRHLRAEAHRFRRGDFGDPAAIHGHDMPGIRVLAARADRVTVRYREVPSGAALRFSSGDPLVVSAVHAWFAAQRRDHGAHAAAG
jgi:hypothetical protein